MTARVLIVDDLRPNIKMLEAPLLAEYFEVVSATTGREALTLCQDGKCDIVLLDVMMPGLDGFEVCRRLKADPRTLHLPVLIVTALDQPSDRLRGLEAGADDYLTKPFAPKELSARIRALLRRARTHEIASTHLSFGDLEIIPEEGVVLRDGRETHLTKTEFRLLIELASPAGRVLSREELLEKIWGYGYFGDGRLVDVHIRRLRTKIESDPANPRHVITVRGMGYKLQQ